MHANVFIPDDYIDLIESQLSSKDELDTFIQACRQPLRKSIRVNTLKTSVEEFTRIAKQHDWTLTSIPWCKEGFWIEADESERALGNSIEHMTGLFYIQEASSMMPPVALFNNLVKPTRVLDMAAAPGSKSTQLAVYMNNQGSLVSNELSASRIKILHHNLERCGVLNHAITHFDATVFGEYCFEQFDAILLDAPCSGEGAIRKDEHAMANWSLSSTNDIAELQKRLIESAFYALKPGGSLVYSTCTLNHLENQDVVEHALQTFESSIRIDDLTTLFDGASRSATVNGALHVYPHHYDSEGFFVAKLTKTDSVTAPKSSKKRGKFPFERCSKKTVLDTRERLTTELKIDIDLNQLDLWQRDKELWLFPTEIAPLLDCVRFQRIGSKLGELHKKGIKWSAQTVVSLAQNSHLTGIELTPEELSQWYQGQDIRPSESTVGKGSVFVLHNGKPIGLGKWVGNRIKNGLPRELVRDGISF
ncbi:RNA methyltransferase RsmF [Vibrio sp. qd031]|uniref:16S rRNA (cytosine(1407)-C(5))-methyltransferase RsmF n=1 Tax=Vibrio sp. qd031 TaxID=1603038 RepID=UPI000A0FAF6E|nr:16S rRNA (cytosine(1407)-C(5))-methyltransferase RsmF [Vibrio sp. qd031]ORT49785.1 RNA methyltransferase RsmF [Vibrio sp. qd031]